MTAEAYFVPYTKIVPNATKVAEEQARLADKIDNYDFRITACYDGKVCIEFNRPVELPIKRGCKVDKDAKNGYIVTRAYKEKYIEPYYKGCTDF